MIPASCPLCNLNPAKWIINPVEPEMECQGCGLRIIDEIRFDRLFKEFQKDMSMGNMLRHAYIQQDHRFNAILQIQEAISSDKRWFLSCFSPASDGDWNLHYSCAGCVLKFLVGPDGGSGAILKQHSEIIRSWDWGYAMFSTRYLQERVKEALDSIKPIIDAAVSP